MVPTWLRRDGKLWRDDYTALRACCRAARDALPRLPRAEEGAFGYFSVDPVGGRARLPTATSRVRVRVTVGFAYRLQGGMRCARA